MQVVFISCVLWKAVGNVRESLRACTTDFKGGKWYIVVCGETETL